jgi:hypothetical protein
MEDDRLGCGSRPGIDQDKPGTFAADAPQQGTAGTIPGPGKSTNQGEGQQHAEDGKHGTDQDDHGDAEQRQTDEGTKQAEPLGAAEHGIISR